VRGPFSGTAATCVGATPFFFWRSCQYGTTRWTDRLL
jgi:hypothetical protein